MNKVYCLHLTFSVWCLLLLRQLLFELFSEKKGCVVNKGRSRINYEIKTTPKWTYANCKYFCKNSVSLFFWTVKIVATSGRTPLWTIPPHNTNYGPSVWLNVSTLECQTYSGHFERNRREERMFLKRRVSKIEYMWWYKEFLDTVKITFLIIRYAIMYEEFM